MTKDKFDVTVRGATTTVTTNTGVYKIRNGTGNMNKRHQIFKDGKLVREGLNWQDALNIVATL